MDVNAKENHQANPFTVIKESINRIIARVRLLNSSQKKVFCGLVFFLFVNAFILVVSIIIFSMLMKKL